MVLGLVEGKKVRPTKILAMVWGSQQ